MNDIEPHLSGALADLGDKAPHDPDLAQSVRRELRRRRLNTLRPTAAVLAVLAVLAVVWLNRPGTARPAAAQPSACGPLRTDPIPIWARAGFTGDSYPPHAFGARGSIVAIVFGEALRAPSPPGQGNKILWVAREVPKPSDTLVIKGRLEGSDRTVTVDTGTSPGPSTIDMPASGCWHLELTWGSHTDSMDLRWLDQKPVSDKRSSPPTN